MRRAAGAFGAGRPWLPLASTSSRSTGPAPPTEGRKLGIVQADRFCEVAQD